MGLEDIYHHTKRSITIQTNFSSGTEREEEGEGVTPDTLVYTFDHSRLREKNRQTIGITVGVLRRA